MSLSLVFVRHAGDIALLTRPVATAENGTRDAEQVGRKTVASRSSLGVDAVEFVRAGSPFDCSSQELAAVDRLDDELGTDTAIRVYPSLFDCSRPNESVQDNEWTWQSPIEVFEYRTESVCWQGYDAVRPTVETITTDRDHGSSTLSVRALEVLRDEALVLEAGESAYEGTQQLTEALLNARPTMTVLQNRVARAFATADSDNPVDVAHAADDAIEAALAADDTVGAIASERVDGKRVATLSRSATVERTLRQGNPTALLVARSLPGGEGIAFADTLRDIGETTVTSDAAFPGLLSEWDADVLLVGADSVLPDGRVLNKVGTFASAVAAEHGDIDCIVVTSVDKIAPAATFDLEPRDANWAPDAVSLSNPTFEATPFSAIDTLVTEDGVLDEEDIQSLATEHAKRQSL
jgi:translation initiation factor 2B subunit (eIF-2B alpha/beta/delta family)